MERKRLLLLLGSILLALTLVLLPVMAGCGEVAPEEAEEVEEAEEAEEAEVEEGLKVVKIRYHDNYGATTAAVLGKEKLASFMEPVANKYGYTLDWTYFWNCALYSPEAAVEATGMGAVDCISPNTYMLRPLDARWGLFGLAFLCSGSTHQKIFLERSEAIEGILQGMVDNHNIFIPYFKGNAVLPEGEECHTTPNFAFYTDRPIWTMEDMADMRIRVMTDPGQTRMGPALGFNAQAITFQEAGMSLQTGMLDGLITCPDYKRFFVPIGLLDYCDYALWWPTTQCSAGGYTFNYDWWTQFPEAMQQELGEAVKAYVVWDIQNIGWSAKAETAAIVKAEMQGTRLTAEEFQRWRDACRPTIWDWWAEGIEGGAEAIADYEALTPDLQTTYFDPLDEFVGDSMIWPD